MKSISFDRLKQVARENIEGILLRRVDMADCTRLAVIVYLDNGSVLRSRQDVRDGLLADAVRRFIDGCDIRSVGELLSLVPHGLDRRIPAWMYGRTVAYMDDATGEWTLSPEEAA